MFTTIRLTNKHREEGGQWYCQPQEVGKLAQVKLVLAECREAEPDADWHLEARGTQAGWHRWEGEGI
jgi:hypothetical protein